MRIWYFRPPPSIHPCVGAGAVAAVLDPNPGGAPATLPVTNTGATATHNSNPGHLRFEAGEWIIRAWLTGTAHPGQTWGFQARIWTPAPACLVSQNLCTGSFGPPFAGVPALFTATQFNPPIEIATQEILGVTLRGTEGPQPMIYHYNGAIGSTSFSYLETPDFYAPGPYGRM